MRFQSWQTKPPNKQLHAPPDQHLSSWLCLGALSVITFALVANRSACSEACIFHPITIPRWVQGSCYPLLQTAVTPQIHSRREGAWHSMFEQASSICSHNNHSFWHVSFEPFNFHIILHGIYYSRASKSFFCKSLTTESLIWFAFFYSLMRISPSGLHHSLDQWKTAARNLEKDTK